MTREKAETIVREIYEVLARHNVHLDTEGEDIYLCDGTFPLALNCPRENIWVSTDGSQINGGEYVS